MRAVWKYDVPASSEPTVLSMPAGAEIVHVACGPTTPTDSVSLWALVDDRQDRVERTFLVVGTGHPLPPARLWRWVGTAPHRVLPLVWHLLEGDRSVSPKAGA